MEFRILGPLEVLDRGQALELGGTRQRALLAILLLRRNETVAAERVLELLYGEKQPATGAKSLHVQVSRLRKTLGADVLHTHGGGYRLETGGDAVDADRFAGRLTAGRALLADADPATAEECLAGALELWRGEALADVAYEDFAQGEIARLGEMRLACVEELWETRLALGRHAEAVGELEQLIGDSPLRERLRAQLMLALYRCGRQADALEAYREARSALDAVGIEPSRRLRELERAILSQDPTLDLIPTTDEAASVSGGAFVGRARELSELVAGLEDTIAGHGRLFLVAGEPGIGKSRLADELAERARSRRALVLVGRCWEAGGAPAYWPWVQSLRAYIRSTDPDALWSQLGAGASEVAQILPELGTLDPDLPEPSALDPENARFRLFDSVASFLKNIAAAAPVVLCIDDLHAADEPSLLLLRFLASEMRDSRLLVLALYRDADPAVDERLAATLAELGREKVTRRISLTGLDQPDIARFVQVSAGAAASVRLVERLHAETDGNPLFVGELVRLLQAEGRLGEDAGQAEIGIPDSIREVIGLRLSRMSDSSVQALTLAAVLGREFELATLALLTETPAPELVDVLDEALAARVIDDISGSPGRMRFSHALIRDTIYDGLTAARRLQLHARAGVALETHYGEGAEPHLAELAYHFAQAAPIGFVEKAVRYGRDAAERAATLLAYEEAVRLYEATLELVVDDVERCELLLALGDAQGRSGDTPASRRTYRAAAELADRLGRVEELARAALGYGGRIVWNVARDDPYLAPLLESALAAIGDEQSELRVMLLARLAGGPLRDATASPARRHALGNEALALARRIDDPQTTAYALAGYISAHHSPDHTNEQVTLATELADLALSTGDLELALEAYEHRSEAFLELGDIGAARSDLDRMSRIAAELRQPSQAWIVAELRAHHALLRGDFEEAEQLMAAAASLGELAESWNAEVSFRLQLYMLRRHQGRLAEMEKVVRQSVDDYPTYPIWRCVLAHMSALLEARQESQQQLDALAADFFASIPFNEMWLASMSLLAETANTLDDRERAAELYELLLPYAGRISISTPEFSAGSTAYYLALLATTLDRSEDAERHFEGAIAMNTRIGARPWLAYTQEAYAHLSRGPGSTDRDGDHLIREARNTYDELGMASRQAEARSRASGAE